MRWLPLFVLCAVVGCGADDERERLLAAIEQASRDAESGRQAALADRVSESYRDERGRDRRTVLALVAARMRGGRDLHLWYRVDSIAVDGRAARVSLWVAIGSKPIDAPWRLEDSEAEGGRLELDWVLEGRAWRVSSAEWRGLSLDDLRGADR